jgi:hypothetical protein
MSARPRISLAGVVLVAAVFAAAPVRAEGPLQAPNPDFSVYYRIPPFFLDTAHSTQCLRVICWSPTHDDVSVNFQLWDAGPDPDRAPIFGAGFALGLTNVGTVNLCPGNRAHPAVGRILAEAIKKLVIECSAEIIDPVTAQTLSTHALAVPPRKKKRR